MYNDENDYIIKMRKEWKYLVSIKDVAKEAGVSVATVSRVINKKGVCAPDTEKAVLDAVAKLGYKINFFGRALRRNKTNVIMVMLTSLANTFCSRVIHSIDKIAGINGYHVVVCSTDGDREKEKYYTSFACNGLFDGVIILNSNLSEEEMSALSSKIPVVQCNEYIDVEDTPYVSIDNRRAAYDMVSHLIRNGRKRIVLFTVDNNLISTRDRFMGYKDALKENGMDIDKDLIICGNYGYKNAVTVFEEFISKEIPFDGVFAISDRMAAGALSVITNCGISVPDEVEVAGFDNSDISYTSKPMITTVSQPHHDLGNTAFEQLKLLMDGTKPENVILPYEIILRESTK